VGGSRAITKDGIGGCYKVLERGFLQDREPQIN